MMAPEFERMRLLGVMIERATSVLKAPLTKIEVSGNEIICWAGSRRHTMRYGYANGYAWAPGDSDEQAPSAIAVGSCSWWVESKPDSSSKMAKARDWLQTRLG
jgi:hypothetical protein